MKLPEPLPEDYRSHYGSSKGVTTDRKGREGKGGDKEGKFFQDQSCESHLILPSFFPTPNPKRSISDARLCSGLVLVK